MTPDKPMYGFDNNVQTRVNLAGLNCRPAPFDKCRFTYMEMNGLPPGRYQAFFRHPIFYLCVVHKYCSECLGGLR